MTSQEAIFIIQNYTINPCGYCHEGGSEVAEALPSLRMAGSTYI